MAIDPDGPSVGPLILAASLVGFVVLLVCMEVSR